MLLVAAVIAALTASGHLSPNLLVVLTFCMGCGAAMAMPAQAAIVSELVPQPMLASAVARTAFVVCAGASKAVMAATLPTARARARQRDERIGTGSLAMMVQPNRVSRRRASGRVGQANR